MRVSVIVVTFNSREVIGRCLDALTRTIGSDDEVIVVDNASQDETVRIVQGYDGPIRLVRSPENLGFAGGCNLGARTSSGRCLVFLNPDTEALPGWIDRLVTAVDGVGGGALVSPKLILTRAPDRIASLGVDVHFTGIPTSRYWSRPASGRVTLEEVGAISGAGFAVPRAVFFELGGFDERLFLYCEDLELSVRARRAGYRCFALGSSEVLHVHRPGMWPSKLYYAERNRWWMLLKLYRPRTLLGLAPALIISEVVVWLFALLSGPAHVRAKARSWQTLLGWLPELRGERSAVAHLRRVSDRQLLRIHGTGISLAQVERGTIGPIAEAVLALLFTPARALAEALADGAGGE